MTDFERRAQGYYLLTGELMQPQVGDLVQEAEGGEWKVITDLTALTYGRFARKFPLIDELPRKLVDAAIAHSEDSGEWHWQGDMEQVIEALLELLPGAFVERFIENERVQDVLSHLP